MLHPRRLRRFLTDSSGATALEYGLILALLAIAVVTAVTTTGSAVYNRVNVASTRLGT